MRTEQPIFKKPTPTTESNPGVTSFRAAEHSLDLENLSGLAVKYWESSGKAIDEDNFSDSTQDRFGIDTKSAKERELEIEQKRGPISPEQQRQNNEIKKLVEILEAVLAEQCNAGEIWFSLREKPGVRAKANTEIMRVSEADRLTNGLNLLLNFKIDGIEKVRSLALNLTYLDDPTPKIYKIEGEIEGQQKLPQIKYYCSDEFFEEGSQNREMPFVVAGINKNHVKELTQLWAESRTKDTDSETLRKLKIKKERELAVHPAQILILEEIHVQLSLFLNQLQINRGSIESMQKITDVMVVIRELLEEKMKEIKKEDLEKYQNEDTTYTQIMRHCKTRNQQILETNKTSKIA